MLMYSNSPKRPCKDQSQLPLAVVADRVDVAAMIEVVDDVGVRTSAEDLLGQSRRRASG